MSNRKPRTERILGLLKDEYFKGKGREPDAAQLWQERVMAAIAESAPVPAPGFITLVGQLSWRLVPATLSLAVVLGILVIMTHSTVNYNPFELLVGHAESQLLTRLLGV